MSPAQSPLFAGQMRTALSAVLKSDVTLDVFPRAPTREGRFRNFVSRSISVLEVRGEPIALRKGASQASDVHLLRIQRGSAELLHEGGCTRLEAGQFVAFRGAQTLQFRHAQSIDLLAIFLPTRALERWLPEWQTAELVSVANHQAEGRLSFDIARDLLESGRKLHDLEAVEMIGETVTRLLARSLSLSSLADATAPSDLAEAYRRKVRHFCRTHLGSPALCVDTVARGTGLSRAALHRLFQQQPHTLMEWVQRERLEACRRLLSAHGEARRSLTEIALSLGFKTPAHFSAAFRRRYGLAPRDYRAAAQRA
ncbi:MAG TPA: helix-turn-helix transcriptional regulator [Polyangiales bacterium]